MKLAYSLIVSILIVFVCTIWVLPSSAHTFFSEEDFPKDSLQIHLDEFVVTAFNRRQNLLEVPGAISSLGSVLLQRENPPLNILPSFQYSPGVFVQQGGNNTARVSIRGIGARVPYATGKIRAYFNNIPLTDASGYTFLEDIDPAVLERIEVIKGPAPSVYGAGLGGTIVLKARNPQNRSTGVFNAFQAGSFGYLRNSTGVDLVGESSAIGVVYSHTQIDGYRENNQMQRDAFTSSGQWNVGDFSQISMLMAFTRLKSHIPSSIDSLTFVENPQSAAANWMRTRGYEDASRFLGGLNWSASWNPTIDTEWSAFVLWHNEKELRPFDVFYQNRQGLGTRFRTVFKGQNRLEGVEASFGGEGFGELYRHSNHENLNGIGVQGNQLTDNREEVFTLNLFSQLDYAFDAFHFSGGINVNFTERDYQDDFTIDSYFRSGSYNYGYIISPRIALSYAPMQGNVLYGSVSHGFAPPSLDETLNSDGFINPDIRPETSWSIELGNRGKLLNDSWFFDVNIYRMWVTDLLVALRVAEDRWVGRNAGASLHQGLELDVHGLLWSMTTPSLWGFREISFRANASLHDFKFSEFVDLDSDHSGNLIPGVPNYVVLANFYFENGTGLYVMPTWRGVGVMAMNDSNSKFTEPYQLIDITVGYKAIWFYELKFDVFFKANNVMNQKYASMILVNAPSFGAAAPRYYYPGLPRNYSIGVNVSI